MKHSKKKAVASLDFLLKIVELATAIVALAATVISLLV
jgi:hypothetical protein